MRATITLFYPLLVWTITACGSSDPGVDPSGTSLGGSANGGSANGGSASNSGGQSTGGNATTGGSVSASGGSNPGTGGATATGGSQANTGGSVATTGGTNNRGGAATTGGTSSGTGGTSSSTGGKAAGGNASGGVNATGGKSAGGNATGGTAAGGAATGGKAAGGTATGGTATGGQATGGAATGGSTGACTLDWGTVPSTVSAWVDASWNAQLGTNIKSRQAWLIDNAMKGKGQINLCIRWGASKAPTATQKSGMAGAVQKWFNLWFSQLNGYGCFPYPNITVKVTGWAVKASNTSWVSDVTGTDAKLYTETDGDGEPKCPDSCSFFSNWSHTFPNCAAGEAFHHDYWFWIDDTLDAAAVGGDWGLRMPVASLNNAMNNVAYDVNTVIHEMGHGFGFQDYYDWTGPTPAGGSLMIVGPNLTEPTVGDTWLIRRTWKEMKSLRGW